MKNKEILNAIRKDIRCPLCNKLLKKTKIWENYSIQIVCPRCKNIVEISKYEKATKK